MPAGTPENETKSLFCVTNISKVTGNRGAGDTTTEQPCFAGRSRSSLAGWKRQRFSHCRVVDAEWAWRASIISKRIKKNIASLASLNSTHRCIISLLRIAFSKIFIIRKFLSIRVESPIKRHHRFIGKNSHKASFVPQRGSLKSLPWMFCK